MLHVLCKSWALEKPYHSAYISYACSIAHTNSFPNVGHSTGFLTALLRTRQRMIHFHSLSSSLSIFLAVSLPLRVIYRKSGSNSFKYPTPSKFQAPQIYGQCDSEVETFCVTFSIFSAQHLTFQKPPESSKASKCLTHANKTTHKYKRQKLGWKKRRDRKRIAQRKYETIEQLPEFECVFLSLKT